MDIITAQRWMPVSIAITNKGPDLQATIEVRNAVSARQGFAWPATYERPLAIAAGATTQLRFYLTRLESGNWAQRDATGNPRSGRRQESDTGQGSLPLAWVPERDAGSPTADPDCA